MKNQIISKIITEWRRNPPGYPTDVDPSKAIVGHKEGSTYTRGQKVRAKATKYYPERNMWVMHTSDTNKGLKKGHVRLVNYSVNEDNVNEKREIFRDAKGEYYYNRWGRKIRNWNVKQNLAEED